SRTLSGAIGGAVEPLHKDVALEQSPLHQAGNRRIDHQRWPAQISLAIAETTVEVLPGGVMHVAVEPRPFAVFYRLAERGHVGEVGVNARQRLEQGAIVELGTIARP